MNILTLVQKQLQKRAALTDAQFMMAKSYRGINYTSAHQSPTRLASQSRSYRGIAYSV